MNVRSSRLAGVLALGVAAAMLCVPVTGAVTSDVPRASTESSTATVLVRGRARLTAAWSTDVARRGQTDVRVRGLLRDGGRRQILLQVHRGGLWVERARTMTRAGRYRVSVPTATYGTFTYRLVAPVSPAQRRAGLTRAVSALTRFRVVDPSRASTGTPAPLGDPRDFSYISTSYARWNPCGTITYRVNTRNGPATALEDTQGAVRRIEQATGLDLEYLGHTDHIPQDSSAKGHPADTQIVIAWASRAQSAMLHGDGVAGVGGPMGWGGTVEEDGDEVLTWRRGTVVINSSFNWLTPGFGSGTTLGKLLMHELGHVVGLGHAEGRPQVMYATLLRDYPTAWGAGDLTGLHSLGAAKGCIRERDGSTPGFRRTGVAVVAPVVVEEAQ